MKMLAITAGALFLATAIPASAAPITYTITGNFSGSTANGAFNNVYATFTGIGDTSLPINGIFNVPSFVAVELSSFKLFVPSDSQSYTITTPAQFGTYLASDIVPGNTQTRLGFIFGFNGSNGFAIESNAFNGYSGLTSFTTTPGSVYYQNASFDTDLGLISINGFTNGTFSASVGAAPEPSTWIMMIVGFGIVGGALRRRTKVRAKITFA